MSLISKPIFKDLSERRLVDGHVVAIVPGLRYLMKDLSSTDKSLCRILLQLKSGARLGKAPVGIQARIKTNSEIAENRPCVTEEFYGRKLAMN